MSGLNHKKLLGIEEVSTPLDNHEMNIKHSNVDTSTILEIKPTLSLDKIEQIENLKIPDPSIMCGIFRNYKYTDILIDNPEEYVMGIYMKKIIDIINIPV